jgi:PAS domain-containing protein
MFQIMNIPKPGLSASIDMEQLTSDLVASISGSPRGALNDALQRALARTVEAKVNAQLAVVLEGIGDAFYSLDAHWRFSYINRAAEAYSGLPRQAMLHKVIWDMFPESEGTDLRRRYEEVFPLRRASVLRGGSGGPPGAPPGIPCLSV